MLEKQPRVEKTTVARLKPGPRISARVRRFIVERQLIQPGDRVLVAASGGADSTCLLLILAALGRSLKIEIHAAYFDHMLRGRRTIAREQRFLRALCDRLGVPLHFGAADVRAYKDRKRLSLEEAARDLRYGFLARTARRNGCTVVATGHTEDDQAETVLLHIIRGAGLRGLAAMAPSAPLPVSRSNAPRLIRPLLSLSRDDTERCCREAGAEPMEDVTNRSHAHLRNRVRHELLPMLRRYNPRVEAALVRLSTAAAEDLDIVSELTMAVLADIETKGGTLRLSRRLLRESPEGLRSSVVHAAIERLLGSRRSFSERHVIAILLAAAGATGTKLDLPRGLRVEVQHEALVLSLNPRPKALPTRRVPLALPGMVRFGPWFVRAELLARRPRRLTPPNGMPTAFLDADALGPAPWLRARRAGDRYEPLGLGHTKKLQDVLVDAHVSRSERDSLPLLCADRGIAWVAGQPPAEWAKITAETTRAIRVRAELGSA